MLKIFERKAKCHLVRMLRNAYMNYTMLDASGPALRFFFFFLPMIFKLLGRQKTTNEEVPVSMQKNLKLKLFS
jgi:hypothetical protein